MKLDSYRLIERAVWEGTVIGINSALQDKEANEKPEKVINIVSKSIMQELEQVVNFDKQELELSDTLLKLLAASEKVEEEIKGQTN